MASGLSDGNLRDWGQRGYSAMRHDVAQHLGQRPEELRIPSVTTIVDRLGGSWLNALHAVDLISAEEAAHRAHPGGYSTQQLVDDAAAAMKEAKTATGLTIGRYTEWRGPELKARRLTDPRARVASESLVRQRLGGPGSDWPAAMEEVLLAHPELRELDRQGTPT
jgi:hypothetical protein